MMQPSQLRRTTSRAGPGLVAAAAFVLLAVLCAAPAVAQRRVPLRSPSPTPTPPRARLDASVAPTVTPTPTATCGPTGTPYCATQCHPCPTIRANCFASACGFCIQNPVCGAGETCEPNDSGPINGCCTCATAMPTPTQTPPATPMSCVGDCDADGTVVVAELVRMVDCVLGSTDPMCEHCAGQAELSIGTLVLAVTHALLGCTTPTPVPVEQVVLAEAAEEFDCFCSHLPFGVFCERAPGHWTDAEVGRHGSAAGGARRVRRAARRRAAAGVPRLPRSELGVR